MKFNVETKATVEVGDVYEAMSEGEKHHMANKLWLEDSIVAKRVQDTVDSQLYQIQSLSDRNDRHRHRIDQLTEQVRENERANRTLKDFKLPRIAQHLIIMYEFDEILRAVLDARQAEEGGKW